MIHLLMQSTSCRDLTVSTSDHEAFAGFSASSVRALKISNSPLILRRPRNAHLKILRSDECLIAIKTSLNDQFTQIWRGVCFLLRVLCLELMASPG
ncbi:uncharacterized protein LOC109704915 isoform X2 [Ananas comosus]|uniref:Uncharacterized protein LOC109704915 isoform X2 n=1 Tax=Ananas comosus TaxID=4615 RepID=A0A6P5EIB7_ANACO|nr:uncharacterized protein LOC109704915 isoform X2 [Ananas comosus]